MQAESSENFPPIEFFLPNDSEDDSDEEILDLLGYDLVEKLDEINVKQNKVITDDIEMEKGDEVISKKKYDNAIIYDDKNNLKKKKRKRRKKIFLQTEI